MDFSLRSRATKIALMGISGVIGTMVGVRISFNPPQFVPTSWLLASPFVALIIRRLDSKTMRISNGVLAVVIGLSTIWKILN